MYVMLSEKGKIVLVVDNYKFNFHKALANNLKRWQCIKRGCKCFIKTVADSNTVIESNLLHDHLPDDKAVLNRQKLSNILKRKALEDICEKPSKLLHRELRSESKNVETISVTDVNCIRKNMYNLRKGILPKVPSNVQEVHDALNSIKIETNKNEQFLLLNNSSTNMIMFSCKTNMSYLSTLYTVYVDGTFRCCTKFFYQLFTIHGIDNENYIPLIFILLANKQTVTYVEAFKSILSECHKMQLNFCPKVVYADFEKAIHSAVNVVFPNAVVRGCRFHLAQSWWRKIQNLGLASEYSKDTDVGSYLRYVFGLPFLEPEAVGDCFGIDFAEIQPTNRAVEKFADYMVETYISEEASFPPTMWANHSSSTQHTTNACEAFHSQFNASFYSSHPNIYHFLEILKHFQTDSYIKIRSAQNVKKIYRKKAIAKKLFVEQKIRELQQNKISMFDFVKCMAYRNKPSK